MLNRKRYFLYLAAVLATLALAPAARAEETAPVVRRVYDAQKQQTAPLPVSWTIAGNTYLSPSEYNDLRNGAMELLKRYPPTSTTSSGWGATRRRSSRSCRTSVRRTWRSTCPGRATSDGTATSATPMWRDTSRPRFPRRS